MRIEEEVGSGWKLGGENPFLKAPLKKVSSWLNWIISFFKEIPFKSLEHRARLFFSSPLWESWNWFFENIQKLSHCNLQCLESWINLTKSIQLLRNFQKVPDLFQCPEVSKYCPNWERAKPLSTESGNLILCNDWHDLCSTSSTILLTHEGSKREAYRDFKPSLTLPVGPVPRVV